MTQRQPGRNGGVADVQCASVKLVRRAEELALVVGMLGEEFSATGLYGPATVTPKLGLQFLHLSEGRFAEAAAAGFSLSAGGQATNSLQPYVGLAASETIITAEGTEITPELRLGYLHELADNGRV
jgi:outer membrane autotransporter protein